MPKNSATRYAGRALTGTVLAAVAVTGVVTAGLITPSYPTANPTPLTADVGSGSLRTIACTGALPQLGADSTNPSAAIPQGELAMLSTGGTAAQINRQFGGTTGAGTSYTVPASDFAAAAGSQSLNTDTLFGLAAINCTEPSTDQWLVGGKTTLGSSTTLTIANPGTNPATVTVTAYNNTGKIEATRGSGALVPAGEARTISLNGLAPNSEALALRVEATGSSVTASLGISEIHDIRPFGIDLVPAQQTGSTQLVIPGVRTDYQQSDSDAAGQVTNTLQLLALDKATTASVQALDTSGNIKPIATAELTPGTVSSVDLPEWPAGSTILVTADSNIVGAAAGTALRSGKTDMVWFTPAAPFTATAAAFVTGGSIYLVNPNSAPATVTMTATGDATKSTTVTIAPFSQQTVTAPADTVQIKSTQPVVGGVTIFNDSGAAAYPVSVNSPNSSQVSVYTD